VIVQRRSTEGSATIRRVPPAVTARSSSTRESSSGAPAAPGSRSTSSNSLSGDPPTPAVRRTCSSGSGSRPGSPAGSSVPYSDAATCNNAGIPVGSAEL
jgi:hypothetical protein